MPAAATIPLRCEGRETSVDGGSGSDTLILRAGTSVTAIDFGVLAGSDQTTGDSVNVANFENLDAGAVTTTLTVTGAASANVITTGSGDDTIDSAGGADIINAGAGNDTISYRGTEASIDAGTGIDTLVLQGIRRHHHGRPERRRGLRPDLRRQRHRLQLRECRRIGAAVIARHHDHRLRGGQQHSGRRRRRYHRWRRRRRRHQCWWR